MKKVLMIAVSVVLTLGMFSCGNKAAEKAQHEADSLEAVRIADSIQAVEDSLAAVQQAILDSLRADSIQKALEDSIAAAQAASKTKTATTTATTTKATTTPADTKKTVNTDKMEKVLQEKLAEESEKAVKTVDAGTKAAQDAVQETNQTLKRKVK